MSQLTDSLDDALADAFDVAGQDFIWNGQPYKCVLNAEASSLTTSKSLFAQSGYPSSGDRIRVAGKQRQVIKVSNAGMEFVPGGLIEPDAPFVDDPANPALAITFSGFIGR